MIGSNGRIPLETLACGRILIVDDQPANVKLLERLLTSHGFQSVQGLTDSRLLESILTVSPPDLILLDIRMPHRDGFEVMRLLQAWREPGEFLPVLVLTAQTDRETRLQALDAGAHDFLTKPFDPPEVLSRLRNLMEMRLLYERVRHQNRLLEETVALRTRELHATRLEIIRRLGRAAEFKDNETGLHILRIGRMTGDLADWLGLPPDFGELLAQASPMHDVGKIGIPDQVLKKAGPLEETEWVLMRDHPRLGAELLGGSDSPLLVMARSVALNHHEKWDGSGYPHGLKGEAIPMEGRITAIVDVFDALMSRRPYKEAWPLTDVRNEIHKQRARHFDPLLVDCFLDNLDAVMTHRKGYEDPPS
ncbi:MAG: response regulator [Magnetococcales bacterium]|nr:response regulator [Magnetococcales bacterium]